MRCLTFRLDRETYAFDILDVQEIIALIPITRVPNVPQHVCGVINLRGKIMSVIDLRARFHMEPVESTERSCIIVVRTENGPQSIIRGVIVDEVAEVVDIHDEDRELTPDFGESLDTSFLVGMGKVKGRVVRILDAAAVVGQNEAAAERGG